MKKILLSFVAMSAIAISSFGQAPEGFKYQAVIRDAGNLILDNQAVGIQFTIEQGSIGGTAVYTETFATSTNAYGLINSQIGSGTTTDDFSTIDWSNGPYFIETSVDLTGGTNYSVMGTSQLMSVPYALYAKTSGNGAGPMGPAGNDGVDGVDGVDGAAGAAGNDGVDGAIGATGAAGNDGADGAIGATGAAGNDGADGAVGATGAAGNDGADGAVGATGAAGNDGADGIGGVTTAGTGISVTGSGTVASPYVVGETAHFIGEFFGGGIIYWLDESGEHGLICAKEDQSNAIRWNAGTNFSTMARGDGPFSGEANTAIIIASQGSGDGATYAARICNELQVTEGGKTYGDWYLPSKEELRLMQQNLALINATALANGGSAFISHFYQSSTEFNGGNKWYQTFGGTFQGANTKNNLYSVRSVRRF